MKRLTVRVNDFTFGKIDLMAKEENTSTNKIVKKILERYFDESYEMNFLKEIDKHLTSINDRLESISKRQIIHLKISKQHFANFGYLSNAVIEEDRCLNEILNKKDLFND